MIILMLFVIVSFINPIYSAEERHALISDSLENHRARLQNEFQVNHNSLIGIFNDATTDSDAKFEAACNLWMFGSNQDKELVREFLVKIAKKNIDQADFEKQKAQKLEAYRLLWEEGPYDNTNPAHAVLLEMSTDAAGWGLIVHLKNNTSILKNLACSENHYRQWNAILALFKSKNPEDKDLAKTIATGIAQDNLHRWRDYAAVKLWEYGDANDKANALPRLLEWSKSNFGWDTINKMGDPEILRKIFRQNDHPMRYKAALMLWAIGTVEEKQEIRSLLISPDTMNEFCLGVGSEKDDFLNREDVIEILKDIFRVEGHLYRYRAAYRLWNKIPDERPNLIPFLIEHANGIDFRWGEDNWNSFISRFKDNTALLKAIAQAQGHSCRFAALESLYKSENLEDKQFASDLFISLSRIDGNWEIAATTREYELIKKVAETPDHPHQFDAIKILWPSYQGDYKNFAADALFEIIKNPHHPQQQHGGEALTILYQSSNQGYNRAGDQGYRDRVIQLMPEFSKTQSGWDAVATLLKDDWDNETRVLTSIGALEDHPHRYDAQARLWDLGVREAVRQFFIQIAKTEGDRHRGDAIEKLFKIRENEDIDKTESKYTNSKKLAINKG